MILSGHDLQNLIRTVSVDTGYQSRPSHAEGRLFTWNNEGRIDMAKHRLIKAERETILLTSEADDTWDIYTFNTDLKNRLRRFAARYPELCKLKAENKELGYVTYIVQKSRVSIHLNSPQSEARRKAASENARRTMNLVPGTVQE